MNSFTRIISHPFWQNKSILFGLIFNILINADLWYLLTTNIGPRSEDIILHYNIIFGIDLLGVWYKIFILPVVGVIIFIINSILAYLFLEKEKILSFFFVYTALAIQIFLAIAGFLLVAINA